MSKTIKTKEVVKDIKIHDSEVNVSGRIKDIGVKTKEKVSENISQTDADSPEQFASDKITDTAKTVVEEAGYASENAVNKGINKGVDKAKERIQERKTEKQAVKEQELNSTDIPNEQTNENFRTF